MNYKLQIKKFKNLIEYDKKIIDINKLKIFYKKNFVSKLMIKKKINFVKPSQNIRLTLYIIF